MSRYVLNKVALEDYVHRKMGETDEKEVVWSDYFVGLDVGFGGYQNCYAAITLTKGLPLSKWATFCRLLIECAETGELVCFSVPKALPLEEFCKRAPTDSSGYEVTEMVEGTEVTLYHNGLVWALCSPDDPTGRKVLPAFMTAMRVNYDDHDTALRRLQSHPFILQLPYTRCYAFVQANDECLYLTMVFEKDECTVNLLSQELFDTPPCKNVFYPRRYALSGELAWSDVVDVVRRSSEKGRRASIMDFATGERTCFS